ncbi:MAG TPA: dephospho-CoA kinase [Gammaproteobacteria bacterium]|nr:dephospho-CoA kinase [Gammaproteobacteria bacterium]
MMIVGLTGGIGSGKSTVADFFKSLGVPVIDADEITRDLVKPGTTVLAEIASHFGEKILNPQGELDRAQLRKKIFGNPSDKVFVESLLHPLVYQAVRAFAENNHQAPYIIASIPLLIETREKYNSDLIDRIVVVDAPEDLQMARVKKRDNFSSQEIRKIMYTQADRQARLNKATDVITNNGDLEKLRRQVVALDAKYRMSL